MSVVEDLDESLQALRVLKAPGVTKARISSISTLCVDNVKVLVIPRLIRVLMRFTNATLP